ncbi:TniQ family protein [Streptomyces sp. NPDC087228]|uniref:TniQ family protein n=1 Tax=Streptomyces sp. NPDC087228 TaxID=3365772 RepID=UPI003805CAA5
MTVKRPFPRVLDPLPGESLPGLLLRVAFRLGLSPDRVAELCRLREMGGAIPHFYLRYLPGPQATALSCSAGLTAAEANNLTLRPFAHGFPALTGSKWDLIRTGGSATSNWGVTVSSRYCPDCLRGDGSPVQNAFGGAWQASWHLPVVFACLRHRRFLEHLCPTCERLVNGTVRAQPSLIKNSRLIGLHPAQCRNTLTLGRGSGKRVCGARLDEHPGSGARDLSAEDLQRLLSLQERIIARLTPTDPPRVGDPMSISFFPDLISTAHLIKLTWPMGETYIPSQELAMLVEEHAALVVAMVQARRAGDTGANLNSVRAVPDDAAQCGALLLAADTLLGDRELVALRPRIRALAGEAFRTSPNHADKILRQEENSDTLVRASYHRLYGDVGGRRQRTAPPDPRFQIEEIPAYLPRDWYESHIASIIPDLLSLGRRATRLLRRAVSIRLAQLATGGTWHASAEFLGIPASGALHTLRVLTRELGESQLRSVFEDAVGEIAVKHGRAVGRVDYARRRRSLAKWRLPTDDWHALRDGLPKLGRGRTSTDPRVGSIFLWSEVTQGEHLHSPTLREHREAGEDTTLLALAAGRCYSTDLHDSRLRLVQRLRIYAGLLAEACDQQTGLRVSVDEVAALEGVRPAGGSTEAGR